MLVKKVVELPLLNDFVHSQSGVHDDRFHGPALLPIIVPRPREEDENENVSGLTDSTFSKVEGESSHEKKYRPAGRHPRYSFRSVQPTRCS